MARRIKDVNIQSKQARQKLKVSAKPYWVPVERGRLHLGYRRLGKAKDGHAQSGSWIVRYYDATRKRYQLEKIGNADDWNDGDGNAVLDYDQALAKARARMIVRAESAIGANGKPWTVRDAMDDYLGYLEGERKSARDARYKAEAFILPKFGTREIASLEVDELRKWRDALAKTPPRVRTAKDREGRLKKPQRYREFDETDEDAKRGRKATANRVVTIFKAALNRAFKDGKIQYDSAWRRLEGFRNVEIARQDFLTVDEAQRLMNASPPEFRMLVQAALLTGCRYSELGRLKISDFHDRSNTIAIATSKSGNARHVHLTDEGIAFFAQLATGRHRNDFLLTNSTGTEWKTSQQTRPMREACEQARIDPPVGFHALRHTWASLSVMGGMPLIIVAENLGHTTTRMVEKHYGHLLASYVREQVRKCAPTFGIDSASNIAPLRAKSTRPR